MLPYREARQMINRLLRGRGQRRKKSPDEDKIYATFIVLVGVRCDAKRDFFLSLPQQKGFLGRAELGRFSAFFF